MWQKFTIVAVTNQPSDSLDIVDSNIDVLSFAQMVNDSVYQEKTIYLIYGTIAGKQSITGAARQSTRLPTAIWVATENEEFIINKKIRNGALLPFGVITIPVVNLTVEMSRALAVSRAYTAKVNSSVDITKEQQKPSVPIIEEKEKDALTAEKRLKRFEKRKG